MTVNTTRLSLPVAAIVAVALVAPPAATAQSAAGSTRIGALIGGSFGAGGSAPGLGVSVRQTVAPRVAVEGDISHVSDFTLAEFPGMGWSWHARMISATANVVFNVPAGTDRLRPFVSVGGGAARVRRGTRGPCPVSPCAATVYFKPVLSAGGGVDVPVWRALAVGLDVRYQRVSEDPALYRPNLRNLTRVGTFVGYRF